MKALVVGGAGFLGRNLVEGLISAGHQCTVIDNDSGFAAARPLPQGARLIESDALTIRKLVLEQPDHVFYLAARVANLNFNAANQSKMLAANLLALLGLPACFALRPRSLVYISTACVYPAESPVPTPEDWGHRGVPEETNRGYGEAKRIGERLVTMLCDESGIPCVIARPFNFYGPWDLFDRAVGHFIPTLLRKMFEGDHEINIWGGPQTRAFTYVTDVVKCLVELAHKASRLHTVNVGSSQEVPIFEVALSAAKLLKYAGRILFSEGPIGYQRRAADEHELQNLIGRHPWTSLEVGLEQTIAWCREQGVSKLLIAEASRLREWKTPHSKLSSSQLTPG